MVEVTDFVKRFRGRLVFEARRLVYHSTLGLRVIKKKKKKKGWVCRYRRKEVVCRVRSPPDVPLTPAIQISPDLVRESERERKREREREGERYRERERERKSERERETKRERERDRDKERAFG